MKRKVLVFTGAPSWKNIASKKPLCSAVSGEPDLEKSHRGGFLKRDSSAQFWKKRKVETQGDKISGLIKNSDKSFGTLLPVLNAGDSLTASTSNCSVAPSTYDNVSSIDNKERTSGESDGCGSALSLDFELNEQNVTEESNEEEILNSNLSPNVDSSAFSDYSMETESEFLMGEFESFENNLSNNNMSISDPKNATSELDHYWDLQDHDTTKNDSISTDNSSMTPSQGLNIPLLKSYVVSEQISSSTEESSGNCEYGFSSNADEGARFDSSALCSNDFKYNLDHLLLQPGILEKVVCCVLHVGFMTEIPTSGIETVKLATLVVCDPTMPLIKLHLWRHAALWSERLRPTDIIRVTQISKGIYKGNTMLQTTPESRLYNFHCPEAPFPKHWHYSDDLRRVSALSIWCQEEHSCLHTEFNGIKIFKALDVPLVQLSDLDQYSVVHLRGILCSATTEYPKSNLRPKNKSKFVTLVKVKDKKGFHCTITLQKQQVALRSMLLSGIGKWYEFTYIAVISKSIFELPKLVSTSRTEVKLLEEKDLKDSAQVQRTIPPYGQTDRDEILIGSFRSIQLIGEDGDESGNILHCCDKVELFHLLNKYHFNACSKSFEPVSRDHNGILRHNCECPTIRSNIFKSNKAVFVSSAFKSCRVQIQCSSPEQTFECVAFSSITTKILKPVLQLMSTFSQNVASNKRIQRIMEKLQEPRRFFIQRTLDSQDEASCVKAPHSILRAFSSL